jgi:hypothetical protein
MKLFSLLTTLILTSAFTHAHSAQASEKILVVMSSSNYVSLKGGGKHPTGFFLNEFATTSLALKKIGYELVITTPGGVTPCNG